MNPRGEEGVRKILGEEDAFPVDGFSWRRKDSEEIQGESNARGKSRQV